MEAYYNAIAQQDAQLAAQATQGGMDQARFGAGLLGTGGNLLTQGYQGQAAALGPYEAYLAQMKQLEALGQQPLDLGINIGAKGQSTGAAQALLSGGMAAAQTRGAADAYNPFATALIGASGNKDFTDALTKRLFNPIQDQGYSVGTGPAYAGGFDDSGVYSPNRRGM
jgi:hypothetical protein